ncbi:MAG: hypothetical protein ACE5G6_06360 [Terriglobia bacterium]
MADGLKKTLAGLRALSRDRSAGAAEIAERAAALLERFCRRPARDSRTSQALARLAETTLTLHPAMAPLLNLANHLQLAAEQGNAALDRLRRQLVRLRRQRRAATRTIARQFAARLPRQAAVITYSYSSTVLAALLAARSRLQRVIVSEARPGGEGRTLAERLARRGIEVRLVIDAALTLEIPAARLVVVGADAVLPRAYVNKVGTGLLQERARRERKPFFVLADTTKFLPAPLGRFHRLEEQPAGMVWRGAPRRVRVVNRVFETIPLEPHVTLLSERGPMTPRRVRAWLARQPVARHWRLTSRRRAR